MQNVTIVVLFFTTALVLLGSLSQEAFAQTIIPNPTPQFNDQFGFSVSIFGNKVLVGAPQDDTDGEDTGIAYLFDATSGNLLKTFHNPSPQINDQFGFSVSLYENKVLVGVPLDGTVSNGPENAGIAYLFDATTGNLLKTFLNPVPEQADEFGFSVSISENNVLIGADQDRLGTLDVLGSAYLFDANTGDLLKTFSNPTPQDEDKFGFSVSISGDKAVVSAPRDDAAGPVGTGTVYVFDVITGNVLHTLLTPAGGLFGHSVSISGNTILVGEPDFDGVAYVFNAASGNLLKTIPNPNPGLDGDLFGFSVSISGNKALVGAVEESTGASNSGAAYSFNAINGNLLRTFLNPTPQMDEMFGRAVSVSGNNIAISALLDNNAGPFTGAVYVFSEQLVGGELIPLDTTALIIGYSVLNAYWLAPIGIGIGLGIYLVKRRF